MRLTGQIQTEKFVDAHEAAIKRHPLLSCRLQKINQDWCWVPAEPEPIRVTRRSGSVFELENATYHKGIDVKQTAGLLVSVLICDVGVKVTLDAHHAVTDGNGMRQFVTEWFHFYHCAVTGTTPKLHEIEPDRLMNRHLFPQPPSLPPISFRQAIVNLWATIRGRTARWTPSHQNRGDGSAHEMSHCYEIILSDEQGDLIREKLAAWGVKLNEFVMACSMSAFAQMAPSGPMNHRISVLNPIDLRMPSDRTLSAANRFGLAFMRRLRSECLNPAVILRSLHDEMTYVRSNYIGVEFIKGLMTASRIPRGINMVRRMGLFIPSLQLTTLGDVARGGKRLLPQIHGKPQTGDLRLETTTGFAPYAEDVPVSVATCESGKTIVFSVRSSPRFLTMEKTQAFANTVVQLLCDFEMPKAQDATG